MIRLEKLRVELRAAAAPMAGILPGADGERAELSGRGGGEDGTAADVQSEDGGGGLDAGAEAVQGGGPESCGTGTVAVPDGGRASGGAASGEAAGGAAQGCGWVKRPRWGSISDEREPKPGRVSAYEQSLRNYAAKKSNIVIHPAVGTSFDSRAEAYEFYNLYSWEVGFGIRWGKNAKNSAKSVTMQRIVCSCEGKPEKANSSSMRTGCRAMIRLHRSNDNGWYIREFLSDHNHPLSGTCIAKSAWPSHKHLDPYTKDLVLHLRNNNMDLSKIHCIIAAFFGAMENVLFNKRALKSLCTRISKEQSDDDVRKTLELFHSLRRDDPSFMYSVEPDNESRVKTLLWTNGRSRMQYAHFGDAITFDTTYRTTLYDMPFGLFVGTNNHCQSVILGGVLMRHETEESFKWVFHEFVTLMGGKAPSTILTDQCREMELAVQEMLPETTHKWCKLHVLSRENECLGPIYSKKIGFKDDFHKIIDDMLTVAEFESAWQHLLDKYNLHGNPFLLEIYDSRHKWAKPYFKGKFCGHQTSTQRSESMNHLFKDYVPPDSSIEMFVRQYNQVQFVLESKEIFEENRSKKKPRIKKGVPIEEHAAKIYTRTMFEKFSEIIFESGSYVVDEKEKGKLYLARHIRSDRRERWSQVEFEVSIRAEDGVIFCECGLGEHMGMPCCHAVKVMIHLGMQEIPAGNIMKRWTRNARDISPEHLVECQEDMTPGMLRALRYSALYVAAMELVNLGASGDQSFQIAMAGLAQAKQKLLEVRNVDGGLGLAEQPSRSTAQGFDMQAMSAVTADVEGGVGLGEQPRHSAAQLSDAQAVSAVTTNVEGDVELAEQPSHSAAQGSDVQEMSVVTIDDTTSPAKKMSLETKAPGRKRKFLHHMTPEGLQ
ncbi:hypothetical protein ACP70R_015384 [Stipagrostis hirtigluma subsp. patula]